MPDHRGDRRILPDEPHTVECFRASGLRRLRCSWAHPVLCPVDVVARAAERIHARLIGYPVFLVGTVLAMFNLIHVTHGAWMLGAGPRWPLRVDPPDLGVPWIVELLPSQRSAVKAPAGPRCRP